MTDTDSFQSLEQALASGGSDAVLQSLIQTLRDDNRPHDLFSALRMQVRSECGLPLVQPETESLDEATRDRLEDGLVSACKEVGEMLIKQGRVRDGWMYLRPVGDREEAVRLLDQVEADDDNLEELIEVCLHEAVDVKRGFGLVLSQYGTCNSITTMDSVVAQLPPKHHAEAAELLLEHLHAELLGTVTADVGQQEGQQPAEKTLAELVADRDWLFGEHSYHVDTTHLASTVRFAETLEGEHHLRLALDLTEYGKRLNKQFQYQGDEPFSDIYPAHALFFRAQLGESVDEALKYFEEKCNLDPMEHGTTPIEVYIDLLRRLGRHEEAIEAYRTRMPENIPARGIAPTLFELCQFAGNFEPLVDHCRANEDLVGFATGLLSRDGD